MRSPGLAAALLAVSGAGWCYEDGAPPGHTGGFGEPDCSLCHSDNEKNAPEGELNVDGLPRPFSPGELYELSIVLRHPELRSGGFQMTIRTADGQPAGKLEPVSGRTRVVSEAGRQYLQHSNDGRQTDRDGSIGWTFQWLAPEDGEPVVLNVAANAANDDLSALGDYIFTLEMKLETAADRKRDGAIADR